MCVIFECFVCLFRIILSATCVIITHSLPMAHMCANDIFNEMHDGISSVFNPAPFVIRQSNSRETAIAIIYRYGVFILSKVLYKM